MPLAGGTIPLAPGPGSLVRFAFHWFSRQKLASPVHECRCAGVFEGRFTARCTHSPVLSGMPLLIGPLEEGSWHPRKGVAPSTCRLEAGGSSAELRRCGKWSLRQDLHPHWLRSERSVSAVGLRRDVKLVLPAGLSPATSAFEARHSLH